MPRPGVRAKGDPEKTKPYITNVPEHTEQRDMGDGFLIVACDGVWDEMSSEEAVHIVAKLILDNADDDSADIAELFIEQVRRHHRSKFQFHSCNVFPRPLETASHMLPRSLCMHNSSAA